MPVYSFKCEKCLVSVEKEFRITEYDIKKAEVESSACENCGCVSLKRTMDSPTFMLKGERWAKDGYSYVNYAELQKSY
jgi:putative FmdB family regulatory protein